MPRKGSVPKRDVLPDPVYHSKIVTKFINKVMLSGKKGVAERVVYDAFEIIRAKTGNDPLEVFETALKNVMPVLEVRARRVGGANYQVPVEVRPDRRMTLGIRWIVNYARLRGEKTMDERLSGELMDAADAALITSLGFDNQPMVALEAFAHGRPVVVSDPVLAKECSQFRAHLGAVFAVHQPMSRSCASTSIARISSTDKASMPWCSSS